jgi:hypothetical protein
VSVTKSASSWVPPHRLRPDRHAAPAAEPVADAAPFIFHDATGTRWPRIKRIALIAAAALIVVVAVVVLAVTHLVPGSAPAFSTLVPQPVQDWQLRGPAATPAPQPAAGAAPAQSTSPPAGQPRPTPRPTPSLTTRPKPRPTHPPILFEVP